MNLDERLAVLTANLELMAGMMKDVLAASDRNAAQNAENGRRDGDDLRRRLAELEGSREQ